MNKKFTEQVANSVWSGFYPTWLGACAAAEAIGGKGLESGDWLERITEQLINYRDELRLYGVAIPPRPSSLPPHCALTRPADIIDFGGSSGWCWDYLQESGAGETVSSYTVVETQYVVDVMKLKGLQSGPVCFQTLEEPLSVVDTLYCNSVLQYFGSNDVFLTLVDRTQPKFILLEDLVATPNEDFFSIQLFHQSAIPYRFIGLQGLLDSLDARGYCLIARYPYVSTVRGLLTVLPMDDFESSKQIRHSSSVLLKRVDQE